MAKTWRWLYVLAAALLLAVVSLAACGPSSSNDPPAPSDTPSVHLNTPPPEPPVPPDETPADLPPVPDETPAQDTDPCAYAGDPLCPDTPITVPPPDLSGW